MVNRFLGDSPLRVLVKLVVLSFIAGVAMSALGIYPQDIVANLRALVEGIWNMGFASLHRFWNYFLMGAVVVVPFFLLMRLLTYRKHS